MTNEEKLNLILRFKAVMQSLKELLGGITAEALDYRPQSDFWTVREHLAHIMDAELFGFIRYRRAIAQPGTSCDIWDQDDFLAGLNYPGQDISEALSIILLLNQVTVGHLIQMTGQDWDKFNINHPERGDMNLEKLLIFRINHTREHMDYISRNQNLYGKR